MTLYDLLRLMGLARRRIVERTIEQIERDEAAAQQRTVDAAKRLRDETERN